MPGWITPEFAARHRLKVNGEPDLRSRLPADEALADDVAEALRFASGGMEGSMRIADEALVATVPPPADNRVWPETRSTTISVARDRERNDAALIKAVHDLMVEAVAWRASDIHIEPLASRLRVRYRVDGVLIEVPGPPKEIHLPLISRLKIMANISIAQKRVPQDGRISWAEAGRAFDLRVSTVPTGHGESIVMRILDQESVRPRLAELGLAAADGMVLRHLTGRPDGIVLVTGPTGSGKTTTLYSCLQSLNQRERKIITVEDPIEYRLHGISQVPVRPDVGMTFASALRALLRQSPNVIMVGEIRDAETAEMAVHAALTGHLVFSTLHTNDAAGAVTRLIDLGIKPYLVAAALRGSIAQRLVRRICPDCRRPHAPSATEIRALGLDEDPINAGNFVMGSGCSACHGTGFHGRLGVFETFLVDEAMQKRIHARSGTGVLRAAAHARGHRSLRDDAMDKAKCGLTTLGEVASIAATDIGSAEVASP